MAVSSDAYPGRQFEGKVTAVNPDIDAATRNVRVQATLANADHRLRPGMFVSVDMILARSEKVLFIPATAVLHASFGDSIFVVEEGQAGADGREAVLAQQRFVRLGARQGDLSSRRRSKGWRTGHLDGSLQTQAGMPVVIDNTLAPQFAFAPKPGNN